MDKEFQSAIDTIIGGHLIHKGDTIELMDRGDGLWDVLVNNSRIFFAIDEIRINQLAGKKLVKA
jgi:hypothetical protein